MSLSFVAFLLRLCVLLNSAICNMIFSFWFTEFCQVSVVVCLLVYGILHHKSSPFDFSELDQSLGLLLLSGEDGQDFCFTSALLPVESFELPSMTGGMFELSTSRMSSSGPP